LWSWQVVNRDASARVSEDQADLHQPAQLPPQFETHSASLSAIDWLLLSRDLIQ
jgi:hypothetical protein